MNLSSRIISDVDAPVCPHCKGRCVGPTTCDGIINRRKVLESFTLVKGVQGYRYDVNPGDLMTIRHFHSGIQSGLQVTNLTAARAHYRAMKQNDFVESCPRNLHPGAAPCPCPDCN